MNATKQYQFAMLLCVIMASGFTMMGIVISLVYLVENSYHFFVLPFTVFAFFGAVGQGKMIEVLGDHLKGEIRK